jgi:hypothetical protein
MLYKIYSCERKKRRKAVPAVPLCWTTLWWVLVANWARCRLFRSVNHKRRFQGRGLICLPKRIDRPLRALNVNGWSILFEDMKALQRRSRNIRLRRHRGKISWLVARGTAEEANGGA